MSHPVNVDSIPAEMKILKNWLLWKYEDRKDSKGNAKKTKIPYQMNGDNAKSTNPETWESFENVIETLNRSPEKFDGIGFAFSEDSGIMGLDFDHVKDPESGEWDPEAIKEIKSLNSYAEMSPSGTGAHVICVAKIPGPYRREGPREMYESGRYFTVTGDHIRGTAQAVSEAQGAVNALYYSWFSKRGEKRAVSKQRPDKKTRLSDAEIIDIASRAKNSVKFKTLYNGDITGYKSQSEADQALCSLIAFYTQETGQIDSIFRGSGLYRAEKWGVANYRDRTINKALQGVTETYDPEKKRKSSNGNPEKIIIHFDEVADRILRDNHVFSMRDNGQIYLYCDGVYRNDGAEAIQGTQIRNVYASMYAERWKEKNPDFDFPEHIPKATTKYVNEVLAYIRAYTHIPRDTIEEDQGRYINIRNGLFDIAEWKLIAHTPAVKSIAQIPVEFNENAECPKINDFLNSVVAEADINLLCEIAGYCLTTDCSFQKAFMLYGVGSNGKSVFLALLEALIGGDNTSAESLQKLEFDKYRTAKLYGKRVNICGDIPDSKMHKSEVFKKLTSGLDLIDGENKYQDSFVFRNTAKLVFSANVLPEGKKDKAYYRRWVLIQFPNNFEGGNEDRNLINKLREPGELSGFLNLALAGLKRLKESGKFTNEKSIEDTQKEYEFNSNPVAAFMEECTQVSDEDCDATVLYLSYVDWCNGCGKQHMSNIGFSRKLNGMGYVSHRESVPGSNSNKKIPKWDNLKIGGVVSEDKTETRPADEQKPLFSAGLIEDDSMNSPAACELLRTDLKNFARSRYNYAVEDIPVFVEKFNAKFPGYRKSLGDDTVMENAERLKTRGWS